MAEINTGSPSTKYFTGYVELRDGARFMAFSSTTDSEREVTQRVQNEYDAVDPIVALAEEMARPLGTTAKKLLEMATIKSGRVIEDNTTD
jgi:hypothetical protein